MNEGVKEKIHQLVDRIEDAEALNALMEDAALYVGQEDSSDELTENELREVRQALGEGEKGEVISFDEFKRHTKEWIEKLS